MSQSRVKKRQLKIVPWYNPAEFKKVYQQLYSREISENKQALDQIAVWHTRCHPSLPSAIEATATLTAALVQDNLWTNSSSISQQLDIQCIYSSAIIRFVNLTVEVHETEYTPNSMVNWAKMLGIPTFIIDIRNEATHAVKPSLHCLRLAADFGMTYLKDAYWEEEVSNMRDFIKEPIDHTDITKSIMCYASFKLKIIYEEVRDISGEDNETLDKVCKGIESHLKSNKKLFVKVLASGDIFIPCDKDLEALISTSAFKLLESQYDVNDDLSPESRIDKPCIPSIPFYHELLWSEMINLLNIHDAVPLFLECLLKSQNRSEIGQKLIISWVMTILKIRENGRFEKSLLKKFFKEKGVVIDWYTMLFAAVQYPCKYTPYIIQPIYCNLEFTDDERSKELVHIMAIYLGEVANSESSVTRRIHTVEETAQIKKLQDAEREKLTGGDDDNIWFLPTDNSYMKWPLGSIINPKNEEDEETEEDNFAAFDPNDFVENIFNNENDIVECPVVDVESSSIHEEINEEFQNTKNFLYT